MDKIIGYNNKILSYSNKLLRPIYSNDSIIRFSFNNCTHIPTDYTDWNSYDASTGHNPWVYIGNNIWDYYPRHKFYNAPWINTDEFNKDRSQGSTFHGLLTKDRFGSDAEIHILSYRCKAAGNRHTGIFCLNDAIYSASNIRFVFNEDATTQVIYATEFFDDCINLRNVVNIDISNVTLISLFFSCNERPYYGSLVEIPNWDTSNITHATGLFSHQMAITEIPLFDTSSMIKVNGMFRDCRNVTHGALALYTQMSTQANPPTTYMDCFENCGIDTPTGRAELEQIPASWGGLGA